MFPSRVLLLGVFATFASHPAWAAPADENGTFVRPLDSTSALGFTEYDARFAGIRRQTCPGGTGLCSDGGYVPCFMVGERGLLMYSLT